MSLKIIFTRTITRDQSGKGAVEGEQLASGGLRGRDTACTSSIPLVKIVVAEPDILAFIKGSLQKNTIKGGSA